MAISVITRLGDAAVVHQHVVVRPKIVAHRISHGMTHHLGLDVHRLVFDQVGQNEVESQQRIDIGQRLAKPVAANIIRREKLLVVPGEIRKLGDDRRHIIDGHRSLTTDAQACHATIDAEKVVGRIGVIVAVAPIYLVAVLQQIPTGRLLAVKQHEVALIKAAVIGSADIQRQLGEIIGTHLGVLLRQGPRWVAENAYLIGVETLHIDIHGRERGVVELVNAFLRHRHLNPSVLSQDALVGLLRKASADNQQKPKQ